MKMPQRMIGIVQDSIHVFITLITHQLFRRVRFVRANLLDFTQQVYNRVIVPHGLENNVNSTSNPVLGRMNQLLDDIPAAEPFDQFGTITMDLLCLRKAIHDKRKVLFRPVLRLID